MLFLRTNEIHELGLLYLNYEILRKGYKTIFLGPSIPLDCLTDIEKHFDNITFVTYITVQPSPDSINEYLKGFGNKLLNHNQSRLWVFSKSIESIESQTISKKIIFFSKNFLDRNLSKSRIWEKVQNLVLALFWNSSQVLCTLCSYCSKRAFCQKII